MTRVSRYAGLEATKWTAQTSRSSPFVQRPHVVHGPLAQSDFAPVAEWIKLNEAALIGYWNGTLSTLELVTSLRRLGVTSEK